MGNTIEKAVEIVGNEVTKLVQGLEPPILMSSKSEKPSVDVLKY